MSSLRPESHIAQQIRRDKLRIQQLLDFPNNLEQLSLHPGLNSDLVQVRNVRNANLLYEPAFFASEMANFSSTLNSLSANRDAMACQELGAAEPSRLMMPQFSESFPHSSDLASSSIHASSKEECAPRNFGNWRNTGSNQGYDWMVNYSTSSVSNETIPNSLVVGELNNVSACQHYVKLSYNELNDVQCSLSNSSIANRESQRQLGGMHSPSTPPPPPLYHNTLQDIVKSASIGAQGSEMPSVLQQTGHGIWVGNVNELELLPSYGNQSNQLRFGNANSSWTNRTSDDSLGWHSPMGFTDKRSEQDSRPVLSDSNHQGLALSLSSNAQSKLSVSQFGEGCGSDDLQSRCGISKDPQYCKSEKSMLKPSIISEDSGKSIQDIVGIPSNHGYRNVCPLGPFTGYATILKSSRFIRPAQQLLDAFCCISGPNLTKVCDVSERISVGVSASTSAEVLNAPESGFGAMGISSGASTSKFYSSNENSGNGGAGSSFCMSSWPDYQQKKAKLLYMQEEVTRRYKQYHQQMQMVVSSFESVAGLSSATPYISMALKSVSRQFRFLKNAITDQLKHVREMLGEDLSAPRSVTGSKHDNNAAKLSYMDQSFQKNKSSGGNIAFLEPQQHVWRPQRGLPERSVAILRAWLFEHFLHPYPTDTDKHMLATQTGLSRNQVSNWFINARVRVWKPMVEEIHMLETKGLTGANHNLSKNEGTCGTEGTSQSRVDQSLNEFGTRTIPEKQLDCLEMGAYAGARDEEGLKAEQWNQEKRSKLECEMTSNVDGTLMGFMPYRRGGVGVGGLGSVSLTLGLRHGVEGAQQQQHKLRQEDQLRHYFGGQQMIHEFGG